MTNSIVTSEGKGTPIPTGAAEASPELRAIAEGLFTWPADEPKLIGSRCGQCTTTTFPAQRSCPRCTSTDVHEHLLARRGTLWTWTVQGFRPKSPPYEGSEEFAPYPVGYVELAGEAKVESLLVGVAIDELTIGMEMELVVVPFHSALTGEDVATFAFRPVRTPQEEDS
jgi:uncharacterized OB-fold protein